MFDFATYNFKDKSRRTIGCVHKVENLDILYDNDMNALSLTISDFGKNFSFPAFGKLVLYSNEEENGNLILNAKVYDHGSVAPCGNGVFGAVASEILINDNQVISLKEHATNYMYDCKGILESDGILIASKLRGILPEIREISDGIFKLSNYIISTRQNIDIDIGNGERLLFLDKDNNCFHTKSAKGIHGALPLTSLPIIATAIKEKLFALRTEEYSFDGKIISPNSIYKVNGKYEFEIELPERLVRIGELLRTHYKQINTNKRIDTRAIFDDYNLSLLSVASAICEIQEKFGDCLENSIFVGMATSGIMLGAVTAFALKKPYVTVLAKCREDGLKRQIEGNIPNNVGNVFVFDNWCSSGASSDEIIKVLSKVVPKARFIKVFTSCKDETKIHGDYILVYNPTKLMEVL